MTRHSRTRRAAWPVFLLITLTLSVPLPAQQRSASSYGLRRPTATLAGSADQTTVNVMPLPRVRCMSVRQGLLNTALVTAVFVAPVALIAGRKSEDGWHAARWATYAGAAYSLGASVFMMHRPFCTSTDPLVYIWAPLAATAGAVIATR